MLRVVFMGSPEFGLPTLVAILAAGHRVVAVYCQPPRPAGRGMEPRLSPVQAFAERAGLPVSTPTSLRPPGEAERLAALAPDVAVVVAYGLILPPAILAAPKHGCLNLHPSRLPRWRGAAPLQRTLMAGDRDTAVMVMRMDEGLDTGPVCLAEDIALADDLTAGELHDIAAKAGAGLMVRALAALEQGTLDCRPQPSAGATYAAKIDKGEARIDWTRPATEIANQIRGLSPFPGAWFAATAGGREERIKVARARLADGAGVPGTVLDEAMTIACGEGAVQLVTLQRAGKKPISAAEFLRGFPLPAGSRLP